VLASSLGSDAEAFLYVSDRCREIGNGVDQVVNQHVILNSVQAARVEPLPRGGLRQTTGQQSRVITAGQVP
jgi:hypothetical protein